MECQQLKERRNMAVNLVGDLLKYSDEEIIDYLEGIMSIVAKNYKTTIETKQPETLWASYGDVSLVYYTLKALKRRNKERLVQQQTM